jgi:hypothetical protein
MQRLEVSGAVRHIYIYIYLYIYVIRRLKVNGLVALMQPACVIIATDMEVIILKKLQFFTILKMIRPTINRGLLIINPITVNTVCSLY